MRRSPAVADAASCAALKTVGISGVRRAASQGCATDYSSERRLSHKPNGRSLILHSN